MAENVLHDIGFNLWAQCDNCGEQILAFGSKSDCTPSIGSTERAELVSILTSNEWKFVGNKSWLCKKCVPPTSPVTFSE